jgi:hypothetical protein
MPEIANRFGRYDVHAYAFSPRLLFSSAYGALYAHRQVHKIPKDKTGISSDAVSA